MSANQARLKIVANQNYRKSGLKSYVWLLKKYNITPTKEGPYFAGNQIHTQGKHGEDKKIGGHSRIIKQLRKKPHHSSASSDTGYGTGTDSASGSEVTADDYQNDSLYLCPVEIGTPTQTLLLDFDTGSADLWVLSTKLPSATLKQLQTSKHAIFDPSKSSTFKQTSGSTWQISYGDQSSASGIVGTDNVKLGSLTIEQQSVEVAQKVSSQFVSSVGDGLLGLAFGTINTVQPTPVKTPVDNLISQQDIPASAKLFTAYLGSWRDANEADKGESFYTFGYVDQSVLKASGASEPYYTPVDPSQGFWQFASASATINGKTITRSANTAIADTGTTLALVEDSFLEQIYAAIPGSKYDDSNQGYVYPSNTDVSKLPVVTVAVGGKQFTIQKEDLGFADAGNGFTYGGIQSRGSLDFDILGDTFLKAIYAVFDQGNERFGAVQRVEKEQNTATPSN